MDYSFNLLSEAWIPCITQDDQIKVTNLVTAIQDAHLYKGIQADYPLTTGSLYLFLLAFSMAIFRPTDDDDWEALYHNGAFPNDTVQRYAEKWKAHFDLFDEGHPFFQDPKIGLRSKDIEKLKDGKDPEPKGLSGLLLHVASGSNPTLFDHSMDDLPISYSPVEAAQLLLMLNAYSLGGLTSASISSDKYYKDSAFSRGIMFLNRGRSLFETLMLNMTAVDFYHRHADAPDLPAWERADPFEPERAVPAGPLDLLTWQSRRIKLLPEISDGQIQVEKCLAAPGFGLVETFTNPYYHLRAEKDNFDVKNKPMRFLVGKALWRDSAAILDMKARESDPPLLIQWFNHLRAEGIIPNKKIRLEAYGMCTDPGKKKAFFYAQASFTAPAVYLDSEALLADLKTAIQYAESVRKSLYFALYELAGYKISPAKDSGEGKDPDKKDIANLLNYLDAEAIYWGQLEPAFYSLLLELPANHSAMTNWKKALMQSARRSLSEAAEMLGSDAIALKAKAKAENRLGFEFTKIPDLIVKE